MMMSRRITKIFTIFLLCVLSILVFIFVVQQLPDSNIYRNIELGALKGIQHCISPDASGAFDRTVEGQQGCLLGSLGNREVTQEVTIVTFVNPDWMPLVRNWLCSLKGVGLSERVLVVAFGSSVCREISPVACYDVNATYPSSSYGQDGYRKMLLHRTEIVLNLLKCGHTLLLSDVDVVFLRNPLPLLSAVANGKDIVFQGDSIDHKVVDRLLPYTVSYACMGFVYMKPTESTGLLWEGVLSYQQKHYWNDQAAVNVCLRHPYLMGRVRWAVLDYGMFPNGIVYFKQHNNNKQALIVHANFLLGMDNKMAELMGAGIWCEESAYSAHCQRLHRIGCVHRQPRKSWCKGLASECTNHGVRVW